MGAPWTPALIDHPDAIDEPASAALAVRRREIAGHAVARKHGLAQRVAAEARWLGAAQGPGVVELVHAGAATPDQAEDVAAGIAELCTSWVDGGCLRDRLRLGRPLGPTEAVGLLADVAETLARLHGLGIGHGRIDATHVLLGDGGPLLTGFAEASPGAMPADLPAVVALGHEVLAAGSARTRLLPSMGKRTPRWLVRRGPHGDATSAASAELARATSMAGLARGLRAIAKAPAHAGTVSRRGSRRTAASLRGSGDSSIRWPWIAGLGDRRRQLIVGGAAVIAVLGIWWMLAHGRAPRHTAVAGGSSSAPGATTPPGSAPSAQAPSSAAVSSVPSTAAPAATSPLQASEASSGTPSPTQLWPPSTTAAPSTASTASTAAAGAAAPPITATTTDPGGSLLRHDGTDFRLSIDAGDQVVLGDWDCDGQRTPAVLRRASGAIDVFDAWASAAGGGVTARRAAVEQEATSLEVVDDAATGCSVLTVHHTDGSVTVRQVAP